MINVYHLRLFITGRTPQSQRALENLREFATSDATNRYEIEVVDILENPALAEKQKILATPTLVKLLPAPICKIIGDLSDRDKVFLGLDIHHVPRRKK